MEINKIEIANLYSTYKEIKIPFYQRDYDWNKNEVYKLLDDIRKNKSDEYYLGTLIFKNYGSKIAIIDGQQRLTTLWLIKRCIYDICIEKEEIVKKIFSNDSDSKDLELLSIIKRDKVQSFDYFEFDSSNYKNGISFQEIIRNGLDSNIQLSRNFKNSYVENYFLIKNYLEKSLSDLPSLVKNMRKVIFTRLIIGPLDDEHVLYSQINSTGKKLTAFDLVKNYLFSEIQNSISFKQPEKDFNDMLIIFNKLFNLNKKDEIIKYFLSYKQEKFVITKSDQIYDTFTELSNSSEYKDNKLKLYNDLCTFCFIYSFAKEKFLIGKNYKFNISLEFLRDYFGVYTTLIVDTFLTILDSNNIDFKNEIINISSNEENIIFNTLKLIEIYIIRRYFCSISSKNSNRFIPTIVKKIRRNYHNNKEDYPNLLYSIFMEQSTENNEISDSDLTTALFPSFKLFEANFLEAPIYTINSKFTKNFIVRLARYVSGKEDKNLDSYSIEHVMPQNLNKWKEDWDKHGIIYDDSELEKYVQTIGNLTITKYNSEFSNDIFQIKLAKMIKNDGFVLNNYIRDQKEWNISAIKTRSEYLFTQVSECWSFKDYKIIKNIKTLDEEKSIVELGKLLDVINKYHLSYSLTQQDLIFILQNYLSGKTFKYIDANILNVEHTDGEISECIIKWLELKDKKDLKFHEKIDYYIDLYQPKFEYLIFELNNINDNYE